MEVAVHSDEHLLHQLFRPFAVADGAIHEVQEPRLIALHQLLKCALFSCEKCTYDLPIGERSKLHSHRHGRLRRCTLKSDTGHFLSPQPKVLRSSTKQAL